MSEAFAIATIRSHPAKILFGWALALGVLSYEVARGHLSAVDQQVAGWVVTRRSPALDGFMRAITFFGSSTWTIAGLLVLSLLAWRRDGLRAVRVLLGALVMGIGLEVVLRLAVSHWRPDTITIPPSMDLATRFELTGFPSGHAFRSGFVFGWLARRLTMFAPPWVSVARILCVVMIGLVGASRLYLNRHWASDVIGGWLMVLLVLAVARCWEEGRWSKG